MILKIYFSLSPRACLCAARPYKFSISSWNVGVWKQYPSVCLDFSTLFASQFMHSCQVTALVLRLSLLCLTKQSGISYFLRDLQIEKVVQLVFMVFYKLGHIWPKQKFIVRSFHELRMKQAAITYHSLC